MNGVRSMLVLIALAALPACANAPLNPSFSLSTRDARYAIGDMQHDKKPFPRPVVIAAGYLDPGSGCAHLATVLRGMTPDPGQVVVVPFFSVATFEACRVRLIDTVRRRFPSVATDLTTEVDVVAVSMGGLIARDAAIPGDGGGGGRPSLHIARLFTISTPFRGADMAGVLTLDERVADMRADSAFLTRLDEEAPAAPYEIIAYVRLGDEIVGVENAVPPSGVVHWVANLPFEAAHLQAQRDDRIVADIARRLRGEAPFATDPPAPLPSGSE